MQEYLENWTGIYGISGEILEEIPTRILAGLSNGIPSRIPE